MTKSFQTRLFVTLLTLATAAAPLGAFAQGGPAQETIHGRIASFDGSNNLQLNDDRGFVDNVRLEPDTVVNPGPRRLQPGQAVTIVGAGQGSVFVANRIDVASGPPPAQSQQLPPPPPPGAIGGVLNGMIGAALDSKNAYVGEDVTLRDVASTDGTITGATLHGTVTDVTHPGQGRNAQIRMHFDRLRLRDGSARPVDGIVVAVDVKTKSNAAKEAGGAFLGMLAGNAIGKVLLGASGFGLLGAVGGFLVAKDNRADVQIPANSTVTVQLVNERRQTQ